MRFAALLAVSFAVAASASKRLIAFNESYSEWMTEEQVMELIKPGQMSNFADITDHAQSLPVDNLMQSMEDSYSAIPAVPVQQEFVKTVFRDALCRNNDCAALSWATVTHLSSSLYPNRYYTQPSGRAAVEWLRDQYKTIAGQRLGRDITIELFEHQWLQPSLIVRMIGKNPALVNQIVVIGGHIDSIAGGATSPAPGADDDASGSSTVYAAFSALVASNFSPDRTVEFHVYAAEEVGLRGSADVAAAYRRENRNVVSMVQFDMVCYSVNKRVGITRDFTDRPLSNFVIQLIQEYTTMGFADSTCGYACSDHGSWNRNNYVAAFPFEAPFGQHNPNIHTTRDTLANCDRAYMGEFAKLAVSYVVELGLSSR